MLVVGKMHVSLVLICAQTAYPHDIFFKFLNSSHQGKT
jgi:hypothetical protein